MTKVRPVARGDVDGVARALARAFADDPVMTWLIPRAFLSRGARFFHAQTRSNLRRQCTVLTTDDHAGASIWAPPGRWRVPLGEILRGGPAAVSSLRGMLLPGLRFLHRVEEAHPREPHWYLATLGTAPEHQGQGIGSALMQPVLDRCDAEGLPAYLESSKERNVPYYRRHGFEVTDEITAPGAPPVWGMWREPRPAG